MTVVNGRLSPQMSGRCSADAHPVLVQVARLVSVVVPAGSVPIVPATIDQIHDATLVVGAWVRVHCECRRVRGDNHPVGAGMGVTTAEHGGQTREPESPRASIGTRCHVKAHSKGRAARRVERLCWLRTGCASASTAVIVSNSLLRLRLTSRMRDNAEDALTQVSPGWAFPGPCETRGVRRPGLLMRGRPSRVSAPGLAKEPLAG